MSAIMLSQAPDEESKGQGQPGHVIKSWIPLRSSVDLGLSGLNKDTSL